MAALEWKPEGKRKVGQSKTTWRTGERNVGTKGGPAGPNSGAQHKAEMVEEKVVALCASWRGDN